MTSHSEIVDRLLNAAIPNVIFDGWGDKIFNDACRDAEIDESFARLFCPRGGLDLAVAFHRKGDQEMIAIMKETDLEDMRFRDRVAFGVKTRINLIQDKELVRRGSTVMALPQNSVLGASLLWETANHIWTALGDTSKDGNWYSKRATLSAVYAATVLFWLGDESVGNDETWDFLDRRIENVMQFEKIKSKMRNTPSLKPFNAIAQRFMSSVRAPDIYHNPLPGRTNLNANLSKDHK